MQVHWGKCDGDAWCKFLTVNLDHPLFQGLTGVYIIWHGGQQPATVYVGQGAIADRVAEHRNNKEILEFSTLGLFVTWASIDSVSRNGVERFLADRLAPKVGSHHPQVVAMPVNFPW